MENNSKSYDGLLRNLWVVVKTPFGVVHIIPVGDGSNHSVVECSCHPKEQEPNLWKHHSADGREQFEDLLVM